MMPTTPGLSAPGESPGTAAGRLRQGPRQGRCCCIVIPFALVVLGLLAAAGLRAAREYEARLLAVGPGPVQTFEVRPGDSLTAVAGRLEAAGLVRDARAVRLRARQRDIGTGVQAGWYELDPAADVDALLDHLVAGRVATRRVTLPEGWILEQMAAACEAAGIGPAAEYRRLATEEAGTFGIQGLPDGASLEGYLFPDTYQMPLDAGPRELIETQVARFVAVWRELTAAQPEPPARPRHELVTIAAMVERETVVAAERPRVAGVIENRLQRGMKLQIDATVLYARGEHKARVLYRDLEIDSPYNTYRVAGLPAGPIANPGRDSLAAVLAPEQHDYLFYVLERDGRHVFTRSAAEHERAVRQSRRLRAQEG